MSYVMFEMRPHAVGGGVECLDAAVARRAPHYLVGIKPQSVVNRDAGPLAPYPYLARVVSDFGHDPQYAPMA